MRTSYIFLLLLLGIALDSPGALMQSILAGRSCRSLPKLSPLFGTTTEASSQTATAAPLGGRTFFIETHGCQMNLADSEIVRSVLLTAGYSPTDNLEGADLILTNTCAIRDNAEAKVYHRLKYFASLRKKNRKTKAKDDGYPLVGLLGCMAERLKAKLLEDEKLGISFIAGPDSYRDLPDLLLAASTDQRAASTALRMDETYAGISPVRTAEGATHAFVTITRGCNNRCTFCIVPFVRGRERSRAAADVIAEVCTLREAGYKEVVLLGQNVNSYHDTGSADVDGDEVGNEDEKRSTTWTGTGTGTAEAVGKSGLQLAEGFSQKWKPRVRVGESDLSDGVRFGELLRRVAEVDPEMRVRFQAPHPKDFPDDVLRLIASTPNICNALHMPSQHGASSMLERMHRGYTREAYLSLVGRARALLGADTPEGIGMGLSSDLIAGFCGETEEEHRDSLSLLKLAAFDQAFTYAYSRREQTYAGLFLQDDVPQEVKARRLSELVDTFQSGAQDRNTRLETGRLHVVLVEGPSAKPSRAWPALATWTGRTDSNKRVVFPAIPLLRGLNLEEATALACAEADPGEAGPAAMALQLDHLRRLRQQRSEGSAAQVDKGCYVAVKVVSGRGHTLRALPIALITLQEGAALRLPTLRTATDSLV